jgi:hypothetical protein
MCELVREQRRVDPSPDSDSHSRKWSYFAGKLYQVSKSLVITKREVLTKQSAGSSPLGHLARGPRESVGLEGFESGTYTPAINDILFSDHCNADRKSSGDIGTRWSNSTYTNGTVFKDFFMGAE